eukprot:UN03238
MVGLQLHIMYGLKSQQIFLSSNIDLRIASISFGSQQNQRITRSPVVVNISTRVGSTITTTLHLTSYHRKYFTTPDSYQVTLEFWDYVQNSNSPIHTTMITMFQVLWWLSCIYL